MSGVWIYQHIANNFVRQVHINTKRSEYLSAVCTSVLLFC